MSKCLPKRYEERKQKNIYRNEAETITGNGKECGNNRAFHSFLLLLLLLLLLGVFSCILGFLSEHLSLLQPLPISSKLLTNNTLYTEVWVGELFCMYVFKRTSKKWYSSHIVLILSCVLHCCWITAKSERQLYSTKTSQRWNTAEVATKSDITEKWSRSTLNNISIHVMGRCFTVLLQHFNNSNVLQQRHVKRTKIIHTAYRILHSKKKLLRKVAMKLTFWVFSTNFLILPCLRIVSSRSRFFQPNL